MGILVVILVVKEGASELTLHLPSLSRAKGMESNRLIECKGYQIMVGHNLLDGIAQNIHPIAKASKYVIM